jgi:hypothetical protein
MIYRIEDSVRRCVSCWEETRFDGLDDVLSTFSEDESLVGVVYDSRKDNQPVLIVEVEDSKYKDKVLVYIESK